MSIANGCSTFERNGATTLFQNSCLTGYLTSPKGRTAAYSILINDIPPRIPISKAKLVQEKIVKIVDQYLLNQESALLATPTNKNNKTTEDFGE